MMTERGWKEHSPQVSGSGEARPLEGGGFDLDDLYDLAWHLAGDDSEAGALVRVALRGRRDAGNDGGGYDLRNVLVRAYLKRNRSLLGHIARLVSRLARRSEKQATAASWLEAALAKLGPQERACLVLRERLGLSVAEIAQITGLGPGRTRLSLFSARERLRLSLPGEGGGAEVRRWQEIT